jgi:hypothetical protein
MLRAISNDKTILGADFLDGGGKKSCSGAERKSFSFKLLLGYFYIHFCINLRNWGNQIRAKTA